MHYTRKINLKELILELDCLDEVTVEALENTETDIESHEVEYSVTRKGEDDYEVLPKPYDVALECLKAAFFAIIPILTDGQDVNFMSILNGVITDAEWWEGENRDMLIELSEDRFEG